EAAASTTSPERTYLATGDADSKGVIHGIAPNIPEEDYYANSKPMDQESSAYITWKAHTQCSPPSKEHVCP
ncbi:hypothetical protein HPB47_020706, partial [Ixodes persulcatus]